MARAFPLGLLWGWLPCGLVYSALVTALTSRSALHGAGTMLAFGLGTLPNLLLAGLLARSPEGLCHERQPCGSRQGCWFSALACGVRLPQYGCLFRGRRIMRSMSEQSVANHHLDVKNSV